MTWWLLWLACGAPIEDADHDGLSPPDDCDDFDPRVGLGPEWHGDADGDGYPDARRTVRACAEPEGFVGPEGACPPPPRGPHVCPWDCDDGDATVHAGARETCDGRDQDCDGGVDDGAADAVPWYLDGDGDGHAGTWGGRSCEVPPGAWSAGTDCDDADADAFPGATETCDFTDEDCDGVTDDGLPTADWWRDGDRDGFGDPDQKLSACHVPAGFVQNDADCDDADDTEVPGAVWYADVDGDGFGDAGAPVASCERPIGAVADATDCDDADPDERPGARWAPDADGDGYGSASDVVTSCERPSGWIAELTDCDDADASRWAEVAAHQDADGDGYGSVRVVVSCGWRDDLTLDSSDCADGSRDMYPGALEICNGADDDCDGDRDEDATGWYDADGDGYGDPDTEHVGYCATGWVSEGTDCDDAEDDTHPGATEWCNGRDDDCDGLVDTDDPDEAGDATWYADADGDGWGDASTAVAACEPPGGYVDEPGDCDLRDPSISPGAAERCLDRVDQDCDGTWECTVSDTILAGVVSSTLDDHLEAASLAGLGDVDGDGYDDLLVGSIRRDEPGREDSGTAWLVHGPLTDEALIGDAGIPILGADANHAGAWVASVGDLDGDGWPDLGIGAPRYDTWSGAVALLSPPTAQTELAAAFAHITGTRSEGAGEAFSAAGDLDGDGADDLVVGIPGYGGNDGAVILVEGPISSSHYRAHSPRLLGRERTNEQLGQRVLGGHDLDGDGIPDVAASSDFGAAVVSGADWSGYAYARDVGVFWEQYSYSLAPRLAAGDIDADGTDDLAIAFPYLGEIWVTTDPLAGGTTPTSRLMAAASGDRPGTALAIADFDADGAGDVLVTAPRAGAVYLVRDAASGTLDLADADAIWRATGFFGGYVGESLAVGDFDGDGVPDAVVTSDESPVGVLLLIAGSEL